MASREEIKEFLSNRCFKEFKTALIDQEQVVLNELRKPTTDRNDDLLNKGVLSQISLIFEIIAEYESQLKED